MYDVVFKVVVIVVFLCVVLFHKTPMMSTQKDAGTLERALKRFERKVVVKPRRYTKQLMVLVLSARENFEERDIIRKTWGGGSDVYFIVGEGCLIPPKYRDDYVCNGTKSVPLTEQLVYDEKQRVVSARLADEKGVVVLPMKDTYRHLAMKLKLAYEWALGKDPLWILKVDDDCYVRVPEISRESLGWDTEGMVVRAASFRQGYPIKSGKWKETNWEGEYPKFPSGAGHVINRNLAEWIVNTSLPFYQGEDTSLGIWLVQAPFDARLMDDNRFSTDGKCSNRRRYVIGHNIKRSKMTWCYIHSVIHS